MKAILPICKNLLRFIVVKEGMSRQFPFYVQHHLLIDLNLASRNHYFIGPFDVSDKLCSYAVFSCSNNFLCFSLQGSPEHL
jgi:hypothetical protein